ncbi:MAG: hypothetical protein ACLT2Z_03935 [Eubacterium sp.]
MQIRAAISNVVDNKCEGALFKVYKVNEQGKKTEISDYNVSQQETKIMKYLQF